MKRIILTAGILSLMTVGAVNFTTTAVSAKGEYPNTIKVENGEALDTANTYVDNFDNGIDTNFWDASNRVWGYNNGGVIPKNISYSDHGTVRLHAKGEYYKKNQVHGFGKYTNGSITGSALVSKGAVTPGRYEVRMKVAPRVGVCNAFWTYTEESRIVTDQQGNPTNKIFNHEIDIEFPGKTGAANSDKTSKNAFNRVYYTNYVGEKYSQQTRSTTPYLNDNKFHTFGFDWYYSNKTKKINYYIDNVLYATHTRLDRLPSFKTKLWLGVWIPNNLNFVGLPKFDDTFMEVDYVKYTPFKNQLIQGPNLGVNKGVANPSDLPKQVNNIEKYNYIPNADFEFRKATADTTNCGLALTNTVVNLSKDNKGPNATLTNGNIVAEVDSINEDQTYNINLDYKGKGSYKVEYFDIDGNKISQDLHNLDSQSWTKLGEKQLTAPKGSFSAKITITANGTLDVDNIFFGVDTIEKEPEIPPFDPPAPSTKGEAYGEGFLGNNFVPRNKNNVGIHKTTFNDNSNQKWVVSNSVFWREQNPFILGGPDLPASSPNASIHLNQDQTPEANTLRKINTVMKDSFDQTQHFVHAMYMDFDIKDFTDIAFYIKDYSIGVEPAKTSPQRNFILYSIDSGVTWKVLVNEQYKQGIGKSNTELDVFVVDGNASQLKDKNFSKIRFAFGTMGWSVGGCGAHLSGVSINRKDNFKNHIDLNNTCNLNNYQQMYMATEYSYLNKEDKDSLNKEARIGDPNQSYQAGYDYLLSYWAQKANEKNSLILLNESRLLETSLILCLLLSTSVISTIVLKNHKKKQR